MYDNILLLLTSDEINMLLSITILKSGAAIIAAQFRADISLILGKR
jgi:hypothetical protein